MKTRSVISMVVVLVLIVSAGLLFKENQLLASDEKLPRFEGTIFQYGSCGSQPQSGAYYEVYDLTTSTLLRSGYTDSTGFHGGGAEVGHYIKVTAIYNNKIGCSWFTQISDGITNADVCINMSGTVCQNEN
jgi:hypothetical protein